MCRFTRHIFFVWNSQHRQTSFWLQKEKKLLFQFSNNCETCSYCFVRSQIWITTGATCGGRYTTPLTTPIRDTYREGWIWCWREKITWMTICPNSSMSCLSVWFKFPPAGLRLPGVIQAQLFQSGRKITHFDKPIPHSGKEIKNGTIEL